MAQFILLSQCPPRENRRAENKSLKSKTHTNVQDLFFIKGVYFFKNKNFFFFPILILDEGTEL